MPRKTRRSIKTIALIGQPTIDANVIELFVNRPAVIRRSSAGQWRGCTGVIHRTREAAPFKYSVKHNLEVTGMQLINHLLRVRKVFRVPGKLAVVGVPSRWRKVGAQIDQRITWQLLLTERAGYPNDFIRPAESAM